MDQRIRKGLDVCLPEFPKPLIDLICDYLDPRDLIVELSSTATAKLLEFLNIFEKQHHLNWLYFAFTPTKGMRIGGLDDYFCGFGLVDLPFSFFDRYFVRKLLSISITEEVLEKLKKILQKRHKKMFISVGENQRDKIDFSLLGISGHMSTWTIDARLLTTAYIGPNDEHNTHSNFFPSQLVNLDQLSAVKQRIGKLSISRNRERVLIQLDEKSDHYSEDAYEITYNFITSFGKMIRFGISNDNGSNMFITPYRKDDVVIRAYISYWKCSQGSYGELPSTLFLPLRIK